MALLTGKLIMYVAIKSHGVMETYFMRCLGIDYTTSLRFSRITFMVVKLMVNQELLGPPRVFFTYTRDGKKLTAKAMLEEVDEKNQKLVYNVIEGDLVEELYKSLKIIFHVEPKGDGQLAIWTFKFEKTNTSMPYPTSYMHYILNVTRDLDAHNTSQYTKEEHARWLPPFNPYHG
ncbi:hypothetical protein OSB04_009157 [Centaurea solstitialis]|uniref:Bet v I/Major latex protein domain-containing protein n=1 Tax=Centaurea solstitialis TaxID=347529 RepID=A0AA38U6G1_9ASTR|nr:hypothetical protein OSB04_009157 [Centaurea solstitialis]